MKKVNSIGEDYGPDVSWAGADGAKYKASTDPQDFLNPAVARSKGFPAVTFETGPMSRGKYDVSNEDWEKDIYLLRKEAPDCVPEGGAAGKKVEE